jgi:predicted MPP superfamily phosphohydrolase
MRYAIVHIADIHYRKEEPEGVSTVINAFIKDLEIQKTILNEYKIYLCITGDIVYEGKDTDSYTSLHKEFNEVFDQVGIPKDFRFLVPGNHDIDQDTIRQDFEEYQKRIYDNIETENGFNNFITQEDYKSNKFENYQLFESDFGKYGIEYSVPGKGWTLDSNLGIFCLNTAVCSLGGVNNVDDKGKLAVYTRGIIQWLKDTKTSLNILLMHHPITHLNKWSIDEIKQIIENNFTLCLCGHDHEQNVFYNKISQNSLICTAPQLYTKKADNLGYAIILLENNCVDKIIYRQYIKGKFLPGSMFSENEEGVVTIQNTELKSIETLEGELKNALAFFKGQPAVFIEPKLSKSREFNNEENLLSLMIEDPRSAVIIAHPQFGLTCLSHHMRLEAFKKGNFWIYLDAKHTKARNIETKIDEQLKLFDKISTDVKCIILDSWDSSNIDHRNIIISLDKDYKEIPKIVMLNYTEFNFNSNFDFSKLSSNYEVLHLQALQRDRVRDFVSQYNQQISIGNEDAIVTKVVNVLEALNIHRTPLNCLTLLKVFEKDFNEDLINRTKMIKTVLFILFTDADSFVYSSNKPDVDDCEYILGKFCKNLIEKRVRRFTSFEFINELNKFCKEKLISLDVPLILNILESNNILIRFNDELEFKHSYWVFYFASNYMLHDEIFRDYILNDRNYVNFPEIIEFYTGLDGRRDDAIRVLLNDLEDLFNTVNNKIGISGIFSPYEGIVWNPSEDAIETIRKTISEKVQKSNLPMIIKDQHADARYNSEAPYDQSIKKFLNEYSVISLMQAIKASSRALRNSNYINTELKKQMFKSILNGWEQISKVILWLSPTLAKEGRVAYEGLGLTLLGDFGESSAERLKQIYLSMPFNVVNIFKDDLSSKKMGPLVFDSLKNNISEIQKHQLSLFLIYERPTDWNKELFEFMNLLHRNSFYLGDLCNTLENEIEIGFVSDDEILQLKKLIQIVVAKHRYGPKHKIKKIHANMTISEKNRLPVDVIIASGKDRKLLK